ncbi:hypothetical protein DIPPA_01082 [Diplonema papillatum]|nr:hypothetical protein DIPPA_01082 [Diplonema papillatum]
MQQPMNRRLAIVALVLVNTAVFLWAMTGGAQQASPPRFSPDEMLAALLEDEKGGLSGFSNHDPRSPITAASLAKRIDEDAQLRYPEATEEELRQQQVLIRLFWVTSAFLRSSSVEHWLDYGSLLGWWRDGRLLFADYDADFSVEANNWARLQDHAGWLPSKGCRWVETTRRHGGRKKGIVQCDWFDPRTYKGADVYGYASTEADIVPPTREGCNQGTTNATMACAICPVPREWIWPLTCAGPELHLRSICVPARPFTHLKKLYGALEKGAYCSKRRCCRRSKHGDWLPWDTPTNVTTVQGIAYMR